MKDIQHDLKRVEQFLITNLFLDMIVGIEVVKQDLHSSTTYIVSNRTMREVVKLTLHFSRKSINQISCV